MQVSHDQLHAQMLIARPRVCTFDSGSGSKPTRLSIQ